MKKNIMMIFIAIAAAWQLHAVELHYESPEGGTSATVTYHDEYTIAPGQLNTIPKPAVDVRTGETKSLSSAKADTSDIIAALSSKINELTSQQPLTSAEKTALAHEIDAQKAGNNDNLNNVLKNILYKRGKTSLTPSDLNDVIASAKKQKGSLVNKMKTLYSKFTSSAVDVTAAKTVSEDTAAHKIVELTEQDKRNIEKYVPNIEHTTDSEDGFNIISDDQVEANKAAADAKAAADKAANIEKLKSQYESEYRKIESQRYEGLIDYTTDKKVQELNSRIRSSLKQLDPKLWIIDWEYDIYRKIIDEKNAARDKAAAERKTAEAKAAADKAAYIDSMVKSDPFYKQALKDLAQAQEDERTAAPSEKAVKQQAVSNAQANVLKIRKEQFAKKVLTEATANSVTDRDMMPNRDKFFEYIKDAEERSGQAITPEDINNFRKEIPFDRINPEMFNIRKNKKAVVNEIKQKADAKAKAAEQAAADARAKADIEDKLNKDPKYTKALNALAEAKEAERAAAANIPTDDTLTDDPVISEKITGPSRKKGKAPLAKDDLAVKQQAVETAQANVKKIKEEFYNAEKVAAKI